MKVKELIKRLEKMDPEANVISGDDTRFTVTQVKKVRYYQGKYEVELG